MGVDFRFDIRLIDDEHELIDHFLDKLASGQDGPHSPELIGEVLADLHDHTINHFSCEETLMDVTGFPGVEEHCLAHQEVIKRINALLEQSPTEPGQSLGQDIIDIIISGIIRHTDDLDRRFHVWFSGKGWNAEDMERFRRLVATDCKISPKDARST